MGDRIGPEHAAYTAEQKKYRAKQQIRMTQLLLKYNALIWRHKRVGYTAKQPACLCPQHLVLIRIVD